jgi:hypothetical protein
MKAIARRSSLAAVALAAVLSTGAAWQALATNTALPAGLVKTDLTASDAGGPALAQSMRHFAVTEGAQALALFAARADASAPLLDAGVRHFMGLRAALDAGDDTEAASGLRLVGSPVELPGLARLQAKSVEGSGLAAARTIPLRDASALDATDSGIAANPSTAARALVDMSALTGLRAESEEAPGSTRSALLAAGRTAPLVDLGGLARALADDDAETGLLLERAASDSPFQGTRALADDEGTFFTGRAAYSSPLHDAPDTLADVGVRAYRGGSSSSTSGLRDALAYDPSQVSGLVRIAAPPVDIGGPPVGFAAPMYDPTALAAALAGN